nr:penicillin-binding transpeptidase domain-containing protein [Chitinophagaceae bacterium]
NEVVESGTGKALKNKYYTICGKTGTAQVADKGIRYTDRVYHGSFVGFFPKTNPQYTICVVLRTKKGSNNYYGGQIALPVFKEVANRLYAINMHDVNSIAHGEKMKSSIAVKGMRSDEFNIIARNLKSFQTMKGAPIWMHNIQTDSLGHFSYASMNAPQNKVPDVSGLGLKDALYMLERIGLKVITIGQGKVVSQSIIAGSDYNKGQKITIQLS